MDFRRLSADNTRVDKSSKKGKSWDKSAHNGLSPLQFGFLQKYLDKNF